MGFFKKEKSKRQQGRVRKTLIVTGALMFMMSFAPAVANNQTFDRAFGIESVYAATATQSNRWESAGGDVWKLKTADGSGYVTNSWFQDLDGSWYMIGSDGAMLSGLITDQSTGKSYLMNINHDGFFGKMQTADGVYNLNGRSVYLTFNQQNDGSFGAILSGLQEARGAGVSEKALVSIPTDGSGGGQAQKPAQTTPPAQTDNSGETTKNIFDGTNTGIGGISDISPEELEEFKNSIIR